MLSRLNLLFIMEIPDNLSPDQKQQIEQALLDAEWLAINGIREVLGIAYGRQKSSYRETLRIAEKLSPEWFNPEKSLLIKNYESKEARYYRELAKREAKRQGKYIAPEDLIKQEIVKNQELINMNMPDIEGDDRPFRKRLDDLQRVLEEFVPESYSEDQAIRQDVFTANYNLPISGTGKDYRQFSLPDDRVLRIRMFHPNKPEHISGADVVYEYYSDYDSSYDSFNSARLAAIQYKMWDKKNLYFGERDLKQIERLKNSFCLNGLCDSESNNILFGLGSFRLPNCTAFIRPTDKLQSADDSLITSGYHVRVCVLEEMWEELSENRRKISLETLSKHKSESSNQEVFQTLFRNEMLGSKTVSVESLNDLYRQFKVLSPEGRIVIHAQDFSHSRSQQGERIARKIA